MTLSNIFIVLIIVLWRIIIETGKKRQREKKRETDEQVNRQTDKQTNKQIDKQINRQTDKQTNRQTDKQTNRQTDKQTNRQTDKQTNRTDIKTKRERKKQRSKKIKINNTIYYNPPFIDKEFQFNKQDLQT